jgi:hypothetical protein
MKDFDQTASSLDDKQGLIPSGEAWLSGIVLIWLLAVGVGVGVLLRYSNTPGRLATPPHDWPGSSKIQLQAGRATLLVFAHPQCPCTHATIIELSRIMTRHQGELDAYVYFYAPRSQTRSWIHSELWLDAAAIPGVQVTEDRGDREVRRFGASTSGQVLLYDAGRHLAFNGGITAARGHIGANDGEEAVVSLLQTGTAAHPRSRVFGCSLLGEK